MTLNAVNKMNDMTVDDKSLMDFLTFDCKAVQKHSDTESFHKQFYIGRLYNFFEPLPDGHMIQRSFGKPQKKIYLNSRCYKGQKYYTITDKLEKPLSFTIYLKDVGGEHLLKRIQKSNSTVS